MKKPQKRILAVLFDIGNVLMLADHRRTIEAYVRHGIPRELAGAYFQRVDYEGTGKGRIEWLAYCENLRREWCVSIPDEEIWRIDVSHIYALDQGVLALIERLMGKMLVGFVTNTRAPEWKRYVELEPRFAISFRTWRSDIAHHYKGDPGVFQSIISKWMPANLKVTVASEEVLFIDDSHANCAIARDAGLQIFQFTERKPWLLEDYLQKLGIL